MFTCSGHVSHDVIAAKKTYSEMGREGLTLATKKKRTVSVVLLHGD